MTLQEIKIIEDDLKYVMGINKFRDINFPEDRNEYEHLLRLIAWSVPAISKKAVKILTTF